MEKEAAERLAKVESRAESSWQQHEMSLAEVAVLRKEKAAADRKCTQVTIPLIGNIMLGYSGNLARLGSICI